MKGITIDRNWWKYIKVDGMEKIDKTDEMDEW